MRKATREAQRLRAASETSELAGALAEHSKAELEILPTILEKGTASSAALEALRALDRAETRALSRLRRAALRLDQARHQDDLEFEAGLFRPRTNPS